MFRSVVTISGPRRIHEVLWGIHIIPTCAVVGQLAFFAGGSARSVLFLSAPIKVSVTFLGWAVNKGNISPCKF